MDMIVNLNNLPPVPALENIRIVRVLSPDRQAVLDFIGKHFSQGWVNESTVALCRQPNSCFIAVRDGQILGFACYDATALGFFGPIGVDPEARGLRIGQALLLTCLHAMAWEGYGYAVIGWCDGAADFYRTVGAMEIPNSAPAQSVYSRLIQKV